MSYYVVAGFLVYLAVELFVRVGVLVFLTGWKYVSWRLVTPGVFMILSPGYWIAGNCKRPLSGDPLRFALRTDLIKNFNYWNVVVSSTMMLVVFTIRNEGYQLHSFAVAVVGWRFMSRSFEIAIAFTKDIVTTESSSNLDNSDRMRLALISYLEIFIYSAAFYASVQTCWSEWHRPLMNSLYVGTLTNVAEVAKSLEPMPFWVFVQVFATLSLVVLSIAGYLGRVKVAVGR